MWYGSLSTMTTTEVIHVRLPLPEKGLTRLVHLHGHVFQVLYRSETGAGHFDPNNLPEFPRNPLRRDVVLVKGRGYAILAFRADNPGAWYDPFPRFYG